MERVREIARNRPTAVELPLEEKHARPLSPPYHTHRVLPRQGGLRIATLARGRVHVGGGRGGSDDTCWREEGEKGGGRMRAPPLFFFSMRGPRLALACLSARGRVP